MKARIPYLGAVVFGVLLLFCSLQLGADENISVTVTGTAPVTGGNAAKARTMALMSAKSIAVEQGAGMVITLNDLEDSRKVELKSQGKVIDYQILSEQEQNGIYSVKIKATVLFPGDLRKQKRTIKATDTAFDTENYKSHVVETERGSIDWDNGFVVAKGRGNLGKSAMDEVKARRVALLDAYATALEMIEGISVDSKTKVKDMTADRKIMTELKATISGAQILAEDKDETTGSYNVMVRVPFWGVTGIQRVLLTRVLETLAADSARKKKATESKVVPDEQADDGKTSEQANAGDENTDQVYTGVVIDARDTDVRPGLFPTVVTENGDTLHSAALADHETVEENGVVSYVEQQSSEDEQPGNRSGNETRLHMNGRCSPMLASLSSVSYLPLQCWPNLYLVAQANSAPAFPRRAGRKPLVIKCLESQGSEKTEILISRQDAEKIKNSPELQESLNNCRVVVVLRSEAGGTEGRNSDGFELFGHLLTNFGP